MLFRSALDLGLTGAPETFVVDSKGIIRQHIVGEVNEENWQSRINPCLKFLQQEAVGDNAPSTQVEEVCQ